MNVILPHDLIGTIRLVNAYMVILKEKKCVNMHLFLILDEL